MPFKSEAQRRYLWANEPEIARDWTDTYGSKIHAANGGIMRLGLKKGSGGPAGGATIGSGSKQSGSPASSGPPGGGSGGQDGTMYYQAPIQPAQQGPHIGEGSKLPTTAARTLSDPREKEDYFEQSWTGQPGIFGLGGGYKNLKTPGVTAGGHQSNFGIGNLFKGAMGMFGGWPGKAASFASGMGNKMFQGRGDYKNQTEWQAAKDARINQKRIDNMLSRRDRGLDYGEQNLYDESKGQYDFRDNQFGENQAGITGTDAAQEFDIKDLITKAAYIKPDFLQEQEWYNNPLGFKTNNLSLYGLGSSDPALANLYKGLGNPDLTIGNLLEQMKTGKYDKLPTKITDKLKKHILENIDFGDTFPKNYSFGNIEPTFKGNRLDIDETKIDDDYKERLKNLESWT